MYTSGGSHRLRELPAQAAGPPEADPATPAGPVPPLLPAGPTEVDPAPGRCQCCQSKQLGAYWGLRAGGWGPGAGGGLGAGRGAGGRAVGGYGEGLGLGAGAGAAGWGAKPCASVASRTVPPAPGCTGRSRLRNCHEGGSSWASRNGSSNTPRAGATAAASKQLGKSR